MDESRIIVISGVSRGLGRAMTQQFAARGHTVLGCARSQKAVDELSQLYPAPHAFSRVDVSREHDVQMWAARMLEQYRAPDLILNNAALMNPLAPLWDVDASTFSELIDVNIKGVFHIVRHFLPAMIDRGSGVVVNFSSGWGRSTSPDVAPYCCSKWAIEGLTRALANDLPAGMAAVPLNPGVIDTDMLQACFGSNASAYPSPDQWASRTVPFLLKLGAEHNGQPLTAPS